MKRRWMHSLLAAGALALCGGAASSGKKYQAYLNDPEAQRVSFQVCLPNRTAFFDPISVDVTEMPENVDVNTPQVREMFVAARRSASADTSPVKSGDRVHQTIREWRAPGSQTDYPQPSIDGGATYNDGGVVRDSRGPIYLSDATDRDQPVFYYFTYDRPKDVVAIHVSVPVVRDGSEQMRTFWFKVPKDVVRGTYTAWTAPASEEAGGRDQPSIFLLLTHGEEMPLYDVRENAPRMRFTLMTPKEDNALTKEVLRARYAAQLERVRLGRPSVPSEGVVFVADRRSSIASCGG